MGRRRRSGGKGAEVQAEKGEKARIGCASSLASGNPPLDEGALPGDVEVHHLVKVHTASPCRHSGQPYKH